MAPRMTLATLIGLVAVIALGLAGMVSASRAWTMAAATVTLAVLLAASLAARLLTGRDRIYWLSFAIFGWTYLILVNWEWVGGQFGHDLTAGLDEAAEQIFPEIRNPSPPSVPGITPAPANPAPPRVAVGINYIDLSIERRIKIGNFVQIGRMLGALAFGMVGGWLGRVLASRGERPAAPG